METKNDEVISTLNDLIQTCRDGQEGFQTASEGVTDSKLKTLFMKYAQQRAGFAAELQDEVRRLGGEPEKTGSASATLHRGWMNIKSAITGKDDGAIISECERGEDSAVQSYEDALNTALPANVESIVEEQYQQVKNAHDQIRSMEKASGAVS